MPGLDCLLPLRLHNVFTGVPGLVRALIGCLGLVIALVLLSRCLHWGAWAGSGLKTSASQLFLPLLLVSQCLGWGVWARLVALGWLLKTSGCWLFLTLLLVSQCLHWGAWAGLGRDWLPWAGYCSQRTGWLPWLVLVWFVWVCLVVRLVLGLLGGGLLSLFGLVCLGLFWFALFPVLVVWSGCWCVWAAGCWLGDSTNNQPKATNPPKARAEALFWERRG